MNTAASVPSDSDLLLGEFLKAFGESANPQEVLANYLNKYPDKAHSILEMAQMNQFLDRAQAIAEKPSPPKHLGEFVLGRCIGGGGMGEIYEAYHERLQRRVAVKIIRRGWTNREARERFIREQQVLAQLHQTHIVPIQTAGEEGSIQYFCMPYVDGASLNHVLDAAFNASTAPGIGSTSVPRLVLQIVEAAKKESQHVDPQHDDPQAAETLPHITETVGVQPESARRNNAASTKIVLNSEYYRSVACLMRDVANAVHHAHRAGVLHRDLKPENIMVEPDGHAWVIDFGLAARLDESRTQTPGLEVTQVNDNPAAHPQISSIAATALTNGIGGGTPRYMAPERWMGKPASVSSDVWSLGATLYELVTLRRAFGGDKQESIRSEILECRPVPASQLAVDLPNDLNAICRKALQKEPAQRYQTASELAEDLGRWLRNEPVKAQPARTIRRLQLWTRRNPGWAAALGSTFFGVVVSVLLFVVTFQNRTAVAEETAKRSQLISEKARADAETAERNLLMLQLQRKRLSVHDAGWSVECWGIVQSIKNKHIPSHEIPDLRDEAALALRGVEAKKVKSLDFQPEELCFDQTGKRLLMTQKLKGDQVQIRQIVRVWDAESETLIKLAEQSHDAYGPITFLKDQKNVPVQLLWDKDASDRIVLWDLQNDKPIKYFEFPSKVKGTTAAWSITASGEHVAVLVMPDEMDTKGLGSVLVWKSESGELLANLTTRGNNVELCPDASMVAVSNAKGTIEVVSIPQGESIAKLSMGHTEINCMAWGRDCLVRVGNSTKGWLLAAGAHGGDLTIWDVDGKIPRSLCRGSNFDVHRLAFSPDGMTLCSVGREFPYLWDVATGNLILRLGISNYFSCLSYSPDGQHLAVGCLAVFGYHGRIDIWNLEESRGEQVLRGLRSIATQVICSSSQRYVAALSENWQLAIWDRKTQRLLHIFETPQGIFVGNAAIAFDSMEQRIAFSAGTEAKIWDLASGEEMKSIELPPGFMDRIAADEQGRLLLVRQESVDSHSKPFGQNRDPKTTPRVCRVRNLLGADPVKTLVEIKDFPEIAIQIQLAPNAKWVVVEGLVYDGQKRMRAIKQFETITDKKGWTLPGEFQKESFLTDRFDALGKTLLIRSDTGPVVHLIDTESGREVRQFQFRLATISADLAFGIHVDSTANLNYKFSLMRIEDETLVLALGGPEALSESFSISQNRKNIVWGSRDGTVSVLDVAHVQRRLAELGFGW